MKKIIILITIIYFIQSLSLNQGFMPVKAKDAFRPAASAVSENHISIVDDIWVSGVKIVSSRKSKLAPGEIQAGREIKESGDVVLIEVIYNNGKTTQRYIAKIARTDLSRDEIEDTQDRFIIPQAYHLNLLNRAGVKGICVAEHFLELEHGLRIILFKDFSEYARGETLKQKIQNAGPVNERDALIIIIKTAFILRDLIGLGVYHADIKPDNIWITANNDVILFDFDLAFSFKKRDKQEDEFLARHLYLCGSPPYMTKERRQLLMDKSPAEYKGYGEKEEIYALGVTLAQMLSGEIRCFNFEEFPDNLLDDLILEEVISPDIHSALSQAIAQGQCAYENLDIFIGDLLSCLGIESFEEEFSSVKRPSGLKMSSAGGIIINTDFPHIQDEAVRMAFLEFIKNKGNMLKLGAIKEYLAKQAKQNPAIVAKWLYEALFSINEILLQDTEAVLEQGEESYASDYKYVNFFGDELCVDTIKSDRHYASEIMRMLLILVLELGLEVARDFILLTEQVEYYANVYYGKITVPLIEKSEIDIVLTAPGEKTIKPLARRSPYPFIRAKQLFNRQIIRLVYRYDMYDKWKSAICDFKNEPFVASSLYTDYFFHNSVEMNLLCSHMLDVGDIRKLIERLTADQPVDELVAMLRMILIATYNPFISEHDPYPVDLDRAGLSERDKKNLIAALEALIISSDSVLITKIAAHFYASIPGVNKNTAHRFFILAMNRALKGIDDKRERCWFLFCNLANMAAGNYDSSAVDLKNMLRLALDFLEYGVKDENIIRDRLESTLARPLAGLELDFLSLIFYPDILHENAAQRSGIKIKQILSYIYSAA
jgi:serine/threonine protein kinase